MSLTSDFRSAFRSLWKAPAFSVAVILTLGLGSGLNTAVFSVVYGVLLRPLDLSQPDRLFTLGQTTEGSGGIEERTGRAVFSQWRARNRSFDGMAAVIDFP